MSFVSFTGPRYNVYEITISYSLYSTYYDSAGSEWMMMNFAKLITIYNIVELWEIFRRDLKNPMNKNLFEEH